MRRETLALMRCPYCGGRVDLMDSLFHRVNEERVIDGILGCHCCYFVVASGIAVLTVEGQANTARQLIEDGEADAARRVLLGVEDAEAASRLECPDITYQEAVDLLGRNFEGGYFLHRFSDPTFVVADAVARTLADAVLAGGRAIDVCGGSGHLTRTLVDVSTSAPPVLMDLSYVKVWLATRFTAPECDGVCADAHSPLPFASGAFRLAICNDAFHYIWTKTLFAREMMRIVDHEGVTAVTHVHNAEQWNPSAGNPLPPAGYRDLFENADTRVFGEHALLTAVLEGHLDLGATSSADELNRELALSVVSSRCAGVYVDRPLRSPMLVKGVLAINPLYAVSRRNGEVRLQLRFPSKDYEDEYRACRLYLPESVVLDRSTVDAFETGGLCSRIEDLRQRRVILDVPHGYLRNRS